MQDKDFDRRIREKLVPQEAPYDPAAWEALSARLDGAQAPPVRAFRWQRWAVAATLLLSLAANAWLGTYLLTRTDTDTAAAPSDNAVASAPADAGDEPLRRSASAPSSSEQEAALPSAGAFPQTEAPNGRMQAGMVPPALLRAARADARPAATSTRTSPDPRAVVRRSQLASLVPPGRIVPGGTTVAGPFSDATANVPASARDQSRMEGAQPPQSPPLAWPPAPANAPLALSVRPPAPDNEESAAEAAVPLSEVSDTPSPRIPRWSFAVAASADANRTTYGDSPLAIGSTWGGDIRLHTSPRGALLLGASYSRKQYIQRFDNNASRFTTPTSSASLQGLLNVAATRQLEAVEGEMEVAGLSLAAEFVWAKRPRGGRWWARGGLSANYLLQQSYEYRYQALTAPPMMFIPNAQGAYNIATLTESSVTEVTRRSYAGIEMGLGYTGTMGRGLSLELGPWCQVPIIDYNRSLERVPLSLGLRSALRFGSNDTRL